MKKLLFIIIMFLTINGSAKTLNIKVDGQTPGNGYTGTMVMEYAFTKCYDEFVVGFNFSYSSYQINGYRYKGKMYTFSELGISAPKADPGPITFTGRVMNGSKAIATITFSYVTPNAGGCYGATHKVVTGTQAAELEKIKNNLTIIVTSISSLGATDAAIERQIDEQVSNKNTASSANNNSTATGGSFSFKVTAIQSKGQVSKPATSQVKEYYNNRQPTQHNTGTRPNTSVQTNSTTNSYTTSSYSKKSTLGTVATSTARAEHVRRTQEKNKAIYQQARATEAAITKATDEINAGIDRMIAENKRRDAIQQQKVDQEIRRSQEQYAREEAHRTEKARRYGKQLDASIKKQIYDQHKETVIHIKSVLNNAPNKLTDIASAKKLIAYGWFVIVSYTTTNMPYEHPIYYNEHTDQFGYQDAIIIDLDITTPVKVARTSSGWQNPTGYADAMQIIHNGKDVLCYGPFANTKDANDFVTSITPKDEWVDYRLHDLAFTTGNNVSSTPHNEKTDFWGNNEQRLEDVQTAEPKNEKQHPYNQKTDFWGNPQHTQEKPKEKKTENSNSDFWGNPK